MIAKNKQYRERRREGRRYPSSKRRKRLLRERQQTVALAERQGHFICV